MSGFRNKVAVVTGADARALGGFVRLTGSGYQRVFAAVAGRVMPKSKRPGATG